MVIIAGLYGFVVWLLFSRLRIFRWTIGSALIVIMLGAAILATFVALLNSVAPSGRVAVVGRVVEVTANVGGKVIDIPITPNALVKKGSVLVQIDPTPFRHKVSQLQASVADARQKVARMKADLQSAMADVEAITSQVGYSEQRLTDLEKLGRSGAAPEFRLQDTALQAQLHRAQLQAAKARELSARLALDSEIDGDNVIVAQLQAQLDNAKWELEEATIRAPNDGYVTAMALTVGDRASPTRSMLSFIVADEIGILGAFPQNGFRTIRPGATTKMAFAGSPGRLYEAKVLEVIRGVGQGQVAASGVLARMGSVGMTDEYPVIISTPSDFPPELLRLGMAGAATAFSDDAGPIGTLALILLWVKAYALYL